MADRDGGRARAQRSDRALAAAFLALAALEVALRGVPGSTAAALAVWTVAAAAMLGRRRRPIAFALWAGLLMVVDAELEVVPPAGAAADLYLPLALFGLGAYVRDPAQARIAAVVGAIGAVGLVALTQWLGLMKVAPLDHYVRAGSILAAAAAGGVVLRDRAESVRAARRRAAAAAAAAPSAVDLALAQERAGLARELHAVVTDCVRSVLADVRPVQALPAGAGGTAGSGTARSGTAGSGTAAGEALASETAAREMVRAALLRVRSTSQQALLEMRRMLVLLRAEPAGAATAAAAAGDGSVAGDAREQPARRRRWAAPLRDQGMVLLVLVVGVAESLLAWGKPVEYYGAASVPVRVLGAVALAAAFLPRRRHPLLTVLLVSAVAVARSVWLDDAFGLNLSAYLAAFIAGASVRPLWLSAAAGTVPIAGGLLSVVIGADWNWEVYPVNLLLFFATMTGAAWLTGVAGRQRLIDLESLRALEREEERRRRRAIEAAVRAERLRVARELHDLVGHGLTTITLQSAMAARVLDHDPQQARAAVDAVADVADDVLDELRQLLAVLDGHEQEHAPQLAQLPPLVARANAAGLHVALELEGDPAQVPAGPAGAAYRIVQEALTNARKHGRHGEVVARVACRRGRVTIAVTSDGAEAVGLRSTRPADRPPALAVGGVGGHGLLSMHERVRIYGGRFRAGLGAGGAGWSVEAELPFDEPQEP